jgi:hypothetical protein
MLQEAIRDDEKSDGVRAEGGRWNLEKGIGEALARMSHRR